MVQISSAFDGGNIEVVDASDPGNIRLNIGVDAGGEHMQWFCFQLANARGRRCRIEIGNAGEVSYPDGFHDYQAVCSADGEHWVRVPTAFDGKRLVISHEPPAIKSFTPISPRTASSATRRWSGAQWPATGSAPRSCATRPTAGP